MVMRDTLGQNSYEVIIPDEIKDIVGKPGANIKLSDHLHALISQGVLDARGLSVYIRALEVENLQEAENPGTTLDLKRKTCTINARIYHDCLIRPREQGKLCLREAEAFEHNEYYAQQMTVLTGMLDQTRDWKTEALVAHNAAQNWRNIASIVNPQIPSQVKKT